MQPLIMLALVGVAAGALGMGFLAPGFTLNVQQLGAQETNLESPINTANVDFAIARVDVVGSGPHTAYRNVIDKCSFHTPTTLDIGSQIFCKLTDKDHDIVAEGNKVLASTLVGSTTTYITIQNTAFPYSNDVQNIEDVKLVVLGKKPNGFVSCSNSIDFCIDGDGITSPGRGTFSATAGAILSTWPSVGSPPEGIDAFNIPGGVWSNAAVGGSDIHLEDSGGACPTATRDAFHQLGGDCKVLDLDASLTPLQTVDCDFEGAAPIFGACPAFAGPLSITYIDANSDGGYNNGEDIIQDVNGNGIFD